MAAMAASGEDDNAMKAIKLLAARATSAQCCDHDVAPPAGESAEAAAAETATPDDLVRRFLTFQEQRVMIYGLFEE